ncbi:Putative Spherulation-specific family 4 [Septoria linicola]|uniref:Spherulation-specific family 4 n=1 Tax=Septoria linicola TaxID=215465 RepID=A0A9Q9AGX6_9PEZI|nr:Putative Spherulation-specific family 4 [Septoria linicola]
MVGYANFLFPLYIYPLSGKWQPLLDAATQYPDVTFTAVINPYSGPDSVNGCPNKDYVEAVHTLNQHSNIKTMGYVHTANRWDCGITGTDICFCTAPAAEVKQNISTYAGWATAGCEGWSTTSPDLHVDSIFIDEAPCEDGGNCLEYMDDLTTFTKTTLTTATGGQVLFNAGAATDLAYFEVADVIVIFEANQTAYESIPDIGVRNGNGAYHQKSSIIIYGASNETSLIQRDTDTILSVERNYFDSLFYTDRSVDQYADFPYDWAEIMKEVNVVAQKNKALLSV